MAKIVLISIILAFMRMIISLLYSHIRHFGAYKNTHLQGLMIFLALRQIFFQRIKDNHMNDFPSH